MVPSGSHGGDEWNGVVPVCKTNSVQHRQLVARRNDAPSDQECLRIAFPRSGDGYEFCRGTDLFHAVETLARPPDAQRTGSARVDERPLLTSARPSPVEFHFWPLRENLADCRMLRRRLLTGSRSVWLRYLRPQ